MSTSGRHQDRLKSIEILKDVSHVDILKEKLVIKCILKKYSEYKFVASPHGGGIDCHRTWETLLVGSIPIVKTSSLDSLYDELPVVIVKEWEECKDIKNLELWYNKYNHLTDRDYIVKKFSYDYWLNK